MPSRRGAVSSSRELRTLSFPSHQSRGTNMKRIVIGALAVSLLVTTANAQLYRVQPIQPVQPLWDGEGPAPTYQPIEPQEFHYWNPSRGGNVDMYGNATSPPGVGLNGQLVRPRSGG